MKNNRLLLTSTVVATLVFAQPLQLLAQMDRNNSGRITQDTTPDTERKVPTEEEVEDPRRQGTVLPVKPITLPAETDKNKNIKDQGQDASNAQNTGMIAGLIGAAFSGAMAAITCTKKPPDPSCPAWLIGAAASALVAGMMAGAKKKSNQTVADVTHNPNLPEPEDELRNDPRYKDLENTLANIKRSNPGTDVNLKTGKVKLADGRVVDASKLNDRAAMKAAGFSDSEIDGFMAATQAALKKGEEEAMRGVDKAPAAEDETILVGGPGGPGNRGGGGFDESAGVNKGKSADARGVASVEGLTRDFNGDPIGVAGENIFVLINRRYNVKAGQDVLIMQNKAKVANSSK